MTHKQKMTYALNVSSLVTYIGCVKVCSNKQVLIYDINIHNVVVGMNPDGLSWKKSMKNSLRWKLISKWMAAQSCFALKDYHCLFNFSKFCSKRSFHVFLWTVRRGFIIYLKTKFLWVALNHFSSKISFSERKVRVGLKISLLTKMAPTGLDVFRQKKSNKFKFWIV